MIAKILSPISQKELSYKGQQRIPLEIWDTLPPVQEIGTSREVSCAHKKVFYVRNFVEGQVMRCDHCHEVVQGPYSWAPPRFTPGALISIPDPTKDNKGRKHYSLLADERGYAKRLEESNWIERESKTA